MLHSLKEKRRKGVGQKQYDNALAFFNTALLQAPDNPEAFKNIGNVYLQQETFGQAETFYQKALTLDPQYWEAIQNLGLIFQKQKHYTLAEKHFLEVRELAPDYFKIYINMGRLYCDLGEYTQAETNFLKATELAPDNLLVIQELANYFCLRKKHKHSINLLNQQFSKFLKEEHYRIHLFLAETYFKRNRYRKSLQHIQTAIKLNPTYSDAFNYLGYLYEFKGAYKKALEAYIIAFSLEINSGTYFKKIENIYQKFSNRPIQAKLIFKKIEQAYQDLLLKNPLSHHIYGELASYYKEQARYKKCRIFAQKAMTISPDPFYNWLIATCCYYEGNFDEAIQNLQEMIKRDRKNSLGWMQKSYEGLIFIYSGGKKYDLAAHYQKKLDTLISSR